MARPARPAVHDSAFCHGDRLHSGCHSGQYLPELELAGNRHYWFDPDRLPDRSGDRDRPEEDAAGPQAAVCTRLHVMAGAGRLCPDQPGYLLDDVANDDSGDSGNCVGPANLPLL